MPPSHLGQILNHYARQDYQFCIHAIQDTVVGQVEAVCDLAGDEAEVLMGLEGCIDRVQIGAIKGLQPGGSTIVIEAIVLPFFSGAVVRRIGCSFGDEMR